MFGHGFHVHVNVSTYSGFLPVSDLRQPIDAAEAVGATVEFLDRPRASTRNRLHQRLVQNPSHLRSYLDYAAASKKLKDQQGRSLSESGEERLRSAATLVHHQLMLKFPAGFETLVLERCRYMAGKLLEKLLSAPTSTPPAEAQKSGGAPLEDDTSLQDRSPQMSSHLSTSGHLKSGRKTPGPSLSLVVCDSVLADKLGQNVKRLFTDYQTSSQLQEPGFTGAPREIRAGHFMRTRAYTNPYERLAECPPPQLPLLAFQIFVLPAIMGWLLVVQLQLFTGWGVGWNTSGEGGGDLPACSSPHRPVELDLQWDRPPGSHLDQRGQSSRPSKERGSPDGDTRSADRRGMDVKSSLFSGFSGVASYLSSSTALGRYASQKRSQQAD